MSKRVKTTRGANHKRVDLDAYRAPVLATVDRSTEEIEKIHAFTVNGTEYFMLTQVPYHHAVRTLDIAANRGEAAAIAYQMVTVLGEDGYQALMTFEGLQREDFEAIATVVNQVVMESSAGKAP